MRFGVLYHIIKSENRIDLFSTRNDIAASDFLEVPAHFLVYLLIFMWSNMNL